MVTTTESMNQFQLNDNSNHLKHQGSFMKQSISDLTTEIKSTTGDIPPPLIGASTTVIDHHVYVFGGRVASTRQMTNSLYILNLSTLEWIRHIAPPDSALPPIPRYFHSATAHLDRFIVIFGGMGNTFINKKNMNVSNQEEKISALDDICIFDIYTMGWVHLNIEPSLFKPQARYAHLATIWDSNKLVIMGGQDLSNQHVNEINIFHLDEQAWIYGSPFPGSHDAYRTTPFCPTLTKNFTCHQGKPITPFWKKSFEDEIDPICIYSNYNFNDLNRDLYCFNPMRSTTVSDMKNHTVDMTKSPILPPGLRFPTSYLMGHYFIVSGTFLSQTQKSFQVWALNLINMTWSYIDAGHTVHVGSWNRGLLSRQQFFMLGHAKRDLKEDYTYRRTNFDQVAIIDLQAFGIYHPPLSTCSVAAQELGLSMLNDPGLGDVVIWTTDQQSILANSVILSQRWPGFSQLLKNFKLDPTQVQKKQLLFPETHSVTLAFLQYVYTDHLMTAQQYQPRILCRLLILADIYGLKRLTELVTFALHQSLTIATAGLVYETATLSLQSALQLRALRIMINAKRIIATQIQSNHETDPQPTPPVFEHVLPLSPSNSATTYSSSYYSENEPLSPTLSVHSSSTQSIRRWTSNMPGLSPSSSEKIQSSRYAYSNSTSTKQSSYPAMKKNASLTTRS